MKVPENAEKNLQWHPAFYAGIQIELKDEADNLIFENEHQLGTKPFGIDVLIIKKESKSPIQKNIGRIFRKHNIVEYKSPTDYLSIDDFYKVYGYTCFYKADVERVVSISIEEVTISLVCKKYPRKLIQHLKEIRNYEIEKSGSGIYYVIGDKIPIQIIVTKNLSREENLWLRNLTDQLEKMEDVEKLIWNYEQNKNNSLYESVMDIIVRANEKKFREAENMSNAFDELLEKMVEKRIKEADEEKRREGEKLINELNKKLAQAGRIEDIIKASEDKEYQDSLIREFGLQL